MAKIRRSRRSRKPSQSLATDEYEGSGDNSPTNSQGSTNDSNDENENQSQGKTEVAPSPRNEDSDSLSDTVARGTPKSGATESNRDMRMRKRRGIKAEEVNDFTVELPDAKRSRRGKKHDLSEDVDEEVTAIKFHTGVLYLYKGRKPRAHFVWKR